MRSGSVSVLPCSRVGVAGAAEQDVVDEVAAALQALGLGGDRLVADRTHVFSAAADDARSAASSPSFLVIHCLPAGEH